jgi:hypothetical protein
MEDILEASRIAFPPYLTGADRASLLSALSDFPKNTNYFLNKPYAEVLQGDGVAGFSYLYKTGDGLRERTVKGIIVTNSCDMDLSNDPSAEANVLFAPIAKLSTVLDGYLALGRSKEELEARAGDIRAQRVTEVCYLPSHGEFPESVAMLDDIRPEPLREFLSRKDARLFSLSQYGFWIFLIKLSMHFVRMREGVRRSDPPEDRPLLGAAT